MENLAPAGSMEALERAVAAGADAVYLGYAAFSARAGAGNFDSAQLAQAVEQQVSLEELNTVSSRKSVVRV